MPLADSNQTAYMHNFSYPKIFVAMLKNITNVLPTLVEREKVKLNLSGKQLV